MELIICIFGNFCKICNFVYFFVFYIFIYYTCRSLTVRFNSTTQFDSIRRLAAVRTTKRGSCCTALPTRRARAGSLSTTKIVELN